MSDSNLTNPIKAFFHDEFPEQYQEPPGLQKNMKPVPDCGEKSYKGSGKLTGRKALVTGGDSGIGRAAAIAYAREGADVAINYLPEEQPDAEEVKELIEAEGRKAVLIPGDLSDESFCQDLVKQAQQELGGLDVLALVAGKQKAVENIEDLPTEQIYKTFEVNVFSLYWVVKAALPYLPEGASIITTTSVEGYNPSPMLLDYAATKNAIIGFTVGLGKQLASKGIRVNSVAPGPIWTPLQISGGQPTENIPKFGQGTPPAPLNRAGQPVELADVYVFLASENSSYVTSQVYGITGGIPTA
ncbi:MULTISPECIES: SDR family oxidoreductase [Bacillus]|uniref:SDR family oxidoreductase n=1 Tax=Bacillus TaxID=1386 RepID=UPI000955B65B|nr:MULTISPECIES: SDR family oxidoreductase [Bacillus]AYK56375.1 SDR family oxidoreductase [Bacillus subtilis subsp. subtilis]AYK66990.1 SDR family oxidoreductase [Bacillus subtilis subsp. subtilis]MBR0022330.1 SDR family oxidoreductase [Bacillus subtilis]MBU8722355.1 SDR family oxidoreductase [Bacillus subtilis]MCL0026960.1 SDR family oxidoreductase [Bacillus sp. C21]